MLVTEAGFLPHTLLPVDFSYAWFALVLPMMGLAMGVFAAPDRAGIMDAVPPDRRGEDGEAPGVAASEPMEGAQGGAERMVAGGRA